MKRENLGTRVTDDNLDNDECDDDHDNGECNDDHDNDFFFKPGHQSTRGSQSGLHTRCPLTRHPGRILNNE